MTGLEPAAETRGSRGAWGEEGVAQFLVSGIWIDLDLPTVV